MLLQDVMAPFVLENLNCSGSEASLLDCPGVSGATTFGFSGYDADADGAQLFTYAYLQISGGVDFAACDPLQGSYAFVACGMTDGPGVNSITVVLLLPFKTCMSLVLVLNACGCSMDEMASV